MGDNDTHSRKLEPPKQVLHSIDRLVAYGIIRKWARAFLLVSALGSLTLISLVAFKLKALRELAVWLALAYAGLAVWFGSYRSSLWLLIGGSAALAALAFGAAREGLVATLAIGASALAAAVLISELLYRSELAKIGGGRALSTRPEPAHAASGGRPLPIIRAFGLKLGVLLLFLVVVAIIVAQVISRSTSSSFVLIVILLLPFLPKLLRRARRLEALAGQEAVALDKRPPILILRSFRDDEILVEGGALVVQAEATEKDQRDKKHTLEEELATALSGRGPVIALGIPGEKMTPLGAARDYASANDWQNAIRQMMRDAQAIVVIAGTSPGLGWELAEIRQHGFLTKTIVTVPSAKTAAREKDSGVFEWLSKPLNGMRSVKPAARDKDSGADACDRIGAVFQALGIGGPSTLDVDVSSVRAFLFRSDGPVVFASRFRGVASVVEALKAAVTYIPEPLRGESIPTTPKRSRTAALLIGTEPSVHLPAALAVLACTPLLLFTGISEAAGILHAGVVATMLLLALFAVNLALISTAVFCWLVKLQGRYASGREYMEDVLEGMAVSLLPLLAALAVAALTSVISGKDGFRFAKVAPLSAMSALSGWQLALGVVVFACVPWVFTRFMVRLRHLWGGPLATVALNVTLAAIVSVGLFFASRAFVSQLSNGGVSGTLRRVPEMEERGKEEQDLTHKLCREFGLDREDVIRWASSLPRLPAEVLILTNDESRITGYRYCVGERVPLWILLRAECKYRVAMRSRVLTEDEKSVKLKLELALIRHDLVKYKAEIDKVLPLGSEALLAYEKVNVVSTHYKDVLTFKNTLNLKVIPIYSDYVQRLERIYPETPELKKIHQNLIDGGNLILEAFKIVKMWTERNDPSLIERANVKIEQANEKIRQYREGMAAIPGE